jgi:hypothetical protein
VIVVIIAFLAANPWVFWVLVAMAALVLLIELTRR